MFDLCSFRFCLQEDSLITPDVESWFPVPRLVQCVSPNVEFLHCLSVLFEKIGKDLQSISLIPSKFLISRCGSIVAQKLFAKKRFNDNLVTKSVTEAPDFLGGWLG